MGNCETINLLAIASPQEELKMQWYERSPRIVSALWC